MPKSKTKSKSCSKGMIKRASYVRKSYKRSDGTMVSRTKVGSTCARDMGRPGKTKSNDRLLPKPDPNIHLSNYGYFLDRSQMKRQEALRTASNVHGNLRVLRRVNLIRNLTGDDKNYKKLSKDIDYLSNRYSKIIARSKSKSKSKNKTKSKNKSK